MATNNAAEMIPRIAIKGTLGVSGPLNSDYDALINKPQINGNELVGNKTNAELGIPTELADLTADSTHRVVTDEQISAWNNKSDFSGSYNDLTDKPTIPDELADLTDDSTHRLVTDTEKETWNAKSDFSGSYNDLTDVPEDLVEDAEYVHTDNNYTSEEQSKLEGIESGAEVNVQSDWNQASSSADDYIKNKPENLVQDAAYVHTDNNYTNTEKNKLSGIAAGAEVNVQSDWNQANSSADDYIKNKPENLVQDASYVHTDNNYTTTEKNKLAGIAAGAEVNVQSDWNQSDSSADDFVKNKPQNLVQDANYVHTDNNYSNAEKAKFGTKVDKTTFDALGLSVVDGKVCITYNN